MPPQRLSTTWRYILRTQGLFIFLRRGLSFLIWHLFIYQSYFLYNVKLDDEVDKLEFTPRVSNFTLKIISTNEEMDKLKADGFNLGWFVSLGWFFTLFSKALGKGDAALCVFVDRQLVALCCVAMSEPAKSIMAGSRLTGDFSNKEAHMSWRGTNPKYRRMASGFGTYVYFEALKFLHRQGFTACRFIVPKSNILTQNTLAKKANITPYGEAYYLKLLGWRVWREKPLRRQA